MQAPRRVRVADLKTNQPPTVIEIVVSFSQGGINYGTYKNEKRGYYLLVTPVEVRDDGGRAFMMFSGVKTLLEEATRYNAKRLQALAAVALDFEKTPVAKQLIDQVCQEKGLTLEHFMAVRDQFGLTATERHLTNAEVQW